MYWLFIFINPGLRLKKTPVLQILPLMFKEELLTCVARFVSYSYWSVNPNKVLFNLTLKNSLCFNLWAVVVPWLYDKLRQADARRGVRRQQRRDDNLRHRNISSSLLLPLLCAGDAVFESITSLNNQLDVINYHVSLKIWHTDRS